MPAAKLTPVLPSTTTHAAGHVFAAVVAHALDHGGRAAVAHREPLAGHAVHVCFAARGAEQVDVAGDDVVLRPERRTFRRVNDEPAARKPLAEIVVGVAFELEGDARRQKRAETLAGRPGEFAFDGIGRADPSDRTVSRLRRKALRPRCGCSCGSRRTG